MAWPMKILEAAFIDSTEDVPTDTFSSQPTLAVNHWTHPK